MEKISGILPSSARFVRQSEVSDNVRPGAPTLGRGPMPSAIDRVNDMPSKVPELSSPLFVDRTKAHRTEIIDGLSNDFFGHKASEPVDVNAHKPAQTYNAEASVEQTNPVTSAYGMQLDLIA